MSQTGHLPDLPLVPGTDRTVTETWTAHSQTDDPTNASITRRALILLSVALALAGCGSNTPKSAGNDTTTIEHPGNPAVYERIASSSDCDTLKQEFDQASENHDAVAAGSEQSAWSLGYMDAADERMRAIGCYG